MDLEITVNEKKSDGMCVRGTVYVDGIKVPYTVYRVIDVYFEVQPPTLQSNSLSSDERVSVWSKSGILNTYSDKDHIKAQVKNKAMGWWIDNGFGKDFWRI
jgi:hypothetical protein